MIFGRLLKNAGGALFQSVDIGGGAQTAGIPTMVFDPTHQESPAVDYILTSVAPEVTIQVPPVLSA